MKHKTPVADISHADLEAATCCDWTLNPWAVVSIVAGEAEVVHVRTVNDAAMFRGVVIERHPEVQVWHWDSLGWTRLYMIGEAR